MGDDMLIIAMNRTVIIHDQRHIHVIMNIIVNPILKAWTLNVPKNVPYYMYVLMSRCTVI